MLETNLYAKYSTRGMLKTTEDANYFTGGMLETTLYANYSTKGMLKSTQDANYFTEKMLHGNYSVC